MIATAIAHETGPIAIRFPRGNGVGVPLDADPQPLPIGVGETLREGDDIALIGAARWSPWHRKPRRSWRRRDRGDGDQCALGQAAR
jgi:deoxyxylulose-5-phosphate synthase